MGSGAIFNHQQRYAATKQRIIASGGSNRRRPLGDIGNFVAARGVGNTVQGKLVLVVQKKVTTVKQSKPDNVIEISPDKVKSSDRSSKKKVHKLTLVLGTARNKSVCDVPKESNIVDIDGADVDNPLAVVDYVEDIYKFYKLTESSSHVDGYMDLQYEITERMRMIVVDWLIGVHTDFQLTPDVLYLAVRIFDRYLAMNLVVRKEEMQLVGITSMFIASKYEEVSAPKIDRFADITDSAYSTDQILAMEKSIMVKFRWTLPFPTIYHFLVRFLKASEADEEMENMVFFLAELGLMQYPMIKYCPSMLAASAVYAAQCTLMISPMWNETLKLHTGYSESQIIDSAKKLVSFHSGAATEHEFQTVFLKYSSYVNYAVALLPTANNLLVID
ncbi:hypothetical protein MKX01_028659 [Papaver californicum]|nr:hypothetical protein MKX01_028659 [Papaver californicum]